MADDAYVRLIREIEAERGKLTAHEGICAERYKNITDRQAEQGLKLDKLVTASERTSSVFDRRVIALLAATVSFLVGLATWEARELYVKHDAQSYISPFALQGHNGAP